MVDRRIILDLGNSVLRLSYITASFNLYVYPDAYVKNENMDYTPTPYCMKGQSSPNESGIIQNIT